MNTTDIVTKVRELAEEFPKAKYLPVGATCYYNRGVVQQGPGDEGCLIGQALMRLGAKWETLEFDGSVEDLLNDPGIFSPRDVDEMDVFWLSQVQSLQDNGAHWGDAVSDADALDLLEDK